MARGRSHRTSPVVFVPAPISDTAKPAVCAKFPPRGMGSTIGVLVSRLKADGDPQVLLKKKTQKMTPSAGGVIFL